MVKKISWEEIAKLQTVGKEFKLIDVLPKESYEKEHIKGATSIPLDQIETEALKTLKKNQTIVVYCASFDCQASTKAAEQLQKLGFKHILDYKGGLRDYKEKDLPLEGSRHSCVVTSGCANC